MIIFLIGVRGAGKTSCTDAFRGRSDIKVLQPSTTRPPRGATDTEYDFRAAFDVPMAWAIQVGQHQYGMRQYEIDSVDVAHIGITVFEPSNIAHLKAFRATAVHEILIVGLDSIVSVAEQVGRIGGNAARAQVQGDIDAQRQILDKHADLLLRGALAENIAAIATTIRLLRNRGGLIDRASIMSLLKVGTLLKSYDEASTQTASYDLRLGDQLLFDGKLVRLSAASPTFSIPPYSFIIAASLEHADLPKFMAGRFDLRVSNFMKGIILSNGPQVDPGFRGVLFCMLYNASDQAVPIKRAEHFATIEFHTTALITDADRPTAYHLFENHQQLDADILERTGSKLLSRIDAVVPRVSKVLSMWTATFAIFAAALGVAVAWSLTTMSDVQKAVAEARRQLDDAKDTSQKINSERAAFESERQKAIEELKGQLQQANAITQEIKSLREQRNR